MHRRHFLKSTAAVMAPLLLPRVSAAQTTSPATKFLFVNAEGGWDPLAVFAPLHDASSIDMEPESETWSIGNLSLVDSPLRPTTRAFFETHREKTLVINGVSMRSVNHETCQAVALTGSTSDERTDWATLLAAGRASDFDLPHVVFSGPSFAGDKSVLVSRAEGSLQGLLDGNLEDDGPQGALSPIASRTPDRFLARRAQATKDALSSRHGDDLLEATVRAQRLVDRRFEIGLSAGGNLRSRASAAISALATDLCRCASVSTGFVWDTHGDNSLQSALFETLFTDLDAILAELSSTTDAAGNPLSESVVVVVLSEMARTPAYNGTGGRDHWPYTSMMWIGPGITGDRQVGAYTDRYVGVGIDPSSGELDAARPGITAEEIGATLLTLGGIDPGEHLPYVSPLEGLLT
jgi:hypothetical protein